MTLEHAMVRQVVLDVLEDKLHRIGFHSGGSYGVEYDSDDKAKLCLEIANAIAERIATNKEI